MSNSPKANLDQEKEKLEKENANLDFGKFKTETLKESVPEPLFSERGHFMLTSKNRFGDIIMPYVNSVPRSTLLKSMGISESTFCRKVREPQKFTLGELIALARKTGIPPEVLGNAIFCIEVGRK